MKRKLKEALEKDVAIVYQHQAPKSDERYPKIIYYPMPSLPYLEGDGTYYGKHHFFTVNLYTEDDDDALKGAVEQTLKHFPLSYVRSIREEKEDHLFKTAFEIEIYQLNQGEKE